MARRVNPQLVALAGFAAAVVRACSGVVCSSVCWLSLCSGARRELRARDVPCEPIEGGVLWRRLVVPGEGANEGRSVMVVAASAEGAACSLVRCGGGGRWWWRGNSHVTGGWSDF